MPVNRRATVITPSEAQGSDAELPREWTLVNVLKREGGGEREIRTLDTGLSPYNALAGRPLRPLGHHSGGTGIIADSPRNRLPVPTLRGLYAACHRAPLIRSAQGAPLPAQCGAGWRR